MLAGGLRSTHRPHPEIYITVNKQNRNTSFHRKFPDGKTYRIKGYFWRAAAPSSQGERRKAALMALPPRSKIRNAQRRDSVIQVRKIAGERRDGRSAGLPTENHCTIPFPGRVWHEDEPQTVRIARQGEVDTATAAPGMESILEHAPAADHGGDEALAGHDVFADGGVDVEDDEDQCHPQAHAVPAMDLHAVAAHG